MLTRIAWLVVVLATTTAARAESTAWGGEARGVNNSNQAVGIMAMEPWRFRPFISTNGSIDFLDLNGEEWTLSTSNLAINNAGQVVGTVNRQGYGAAFLYSGGRMIELGTLGGTESTALGINDAGQVVGYSRNSAGEERAFLYSNGQMAALSGVGGVSSSAVDINGRGQVAGTYRTADGGGHAFLYTDGSVVKIVDQGVGSSGAFGINDAGDVVGFFQASSEATHAFFYSDGELIDLGTLGGNYAAASAVNSHGQVVGESSTVGWGGFNAFLFSDGVMNNLNDLIDPSLGWRITTASSINDHGAIAAIGIHADYPYMQALLLTPSFDVLPQASVARQSLRYDVLRLTPSQAVVPEPRSVVLLSVSALALGLVLRGRRSRLLRASFTS